MIKQLHPQYYFIPARIILFLLDVVAAMADGRKTIWNPRKRHLGAAGSGGGGGIELVDLRAAHDEPRRGEAAFAAAAAAGVQYARECACVRARISMRMRARMVRLHICARPNMCELGRTSERLAEYVCARIYSD